MSSTSYIVKSRNLELKITVEEVSKLHIHEEIIPDILSWLVEKIKRDGVFKDPIIVDEKTLVVLDGMHRVAAMQELGYKYIPICLVDYDNPSIGLYTWTRVVKAGEHTAAYKSAEDAWKSMLEGISALGYRLVSVASEEAGREMLARRELLALVVSSKGLAGVKAPVRDIKAIYDGIKRVELMLANKGFKVEYHTERDGVEMALKGNAVAVIIPPGITKNEVREVALKGMVFIHKATRHVIPARPLNINVPLSWLTGELPIDQVKKMLVEHLSKKTIKILPPGTVLDRRYEEELYVFE